MLTVPDVVAKKAKAHGAHDWLRKLPALVASLETDWNLTAGAVLPGGTEALVVDAVQHSGQSAVLKLLVPRPGDHAANEARALALVDGAGCAQLYAYDEGRHALLIERLGPSMFDLAVPFDERLSILGDLARQLWRPAEPGSFRSGAEKAQWLADFLVAQWPALDQACSKPAYDHALACAHRRRVAHDPDRAVFVHGDIHEWNALQAGAGFKLVDPDGLIAEPEYDLGILMREDPLELMAGDPFDRASRLAKQSGTDADAIWEWGVIERVTTGLVATQIGLQPVGQQMLDAADTIARQA